MASMLKSLRLAADPNRLRILLLLEKGGLSVAELQDILSKGQSQISTHLAQLKQAGLVDDRRMGKNSFYRLTAPAEFMQVLQQAGDQGPPAEHGRRRTRSPRSARTARRSAPRFADGRTTCAAISTNWPANSDGSTCRGGRGK